MLHRSASCRFGGISVCILLVLVVCRRCLIATAGPSPVAAETQASQVDDAPGPRPRAGVDGDDLPKQDHDTTERNATITSRAPSLGRVAYWMPVQVNVQFESQVNYYFTAQRDLDAIVQKATEMLDALVANFARPTFVDVQRVNLPDLRRVDVHLIYFNRQSRGWRDRLPPTGGGYLRKIRELFDLRWWARRTFQTARLEDRGAGTIRSLDDAAKPTFSIGMFTREATSYERRPRTPPYDGFFQSVNNPPPQPWPRLLNDGWGTGFFPVLEYAGDNWQMQNNLVLKWLSEGGTVEDAVNRAKRQDPTFCVDELVADQLAAQALMDLANSENPPP